MVVAYFLANSHVIFTIVGRFEMTHEWLEAIGCGVQTKGKDGICRPPDNESR
jgi:hypothetical protein